MGQVPHRIEEHVLTETSLPPRSSVVREGADSPLGIEPVRYAFVRSKLFSLGSWDAYFRTSPTSPAQSLLLRDDVYTCLAHDLQPRSSCMAEGLELGKCGVCLACHTRTSIIPSAAGSASIALMMRTYLTYQRDICGHRMAMDKLSDILAAARPMQDLPCTEHY